MSKVVIITDQHFGIRNDAQFMLDYQEKFYTEVFFPYLKKNNIKEVWNLGDLFDRRKYINFNTLNRTRKMFLDPLRDNGIKMYIIPGNHDVYAKNTNEVNSLKLLCSEYENIELFEVPTLHNGALFVPWINNENYSESLKAIKETSAKICCGHFEISGFEMQLGVLNEHGMDKSEFRKFKKVFSGHFHTTSQNDNIKYLGCPMEFTFADCNDPKFFYEFDVKTHDLKAIRNTNRLYHKLYYNDLENDYTKVNFEDFSSKIVKLYVVKKTKPAIFDNFVESIYNANPIDFVIHEDYSEFGAASNSSDISILRSKTTKDLISDYIDSVENTDLDKNKLKNMMNSIYIEAVTLSDD